MGKLDKFLGDCDGHFRHNDEDSFPWDTTDHAVWYSLLVVEDGKIEKYGFTPAKGQKASLSLALKEIGPNDEALLLGVWTGMYRTDLFILDIQKAIEKLDALT